MDTTSIILSDLEIRQPELSVVRERCTPASHLINGARCSTLDSCLLNGALLARILPMKSHKIPQLNLAIKIAADCHEKQFCWKGEPYFMHCVRVMNAVDGPILKSVAVLHDVIEDTNITRDRLVELGVSTLVVQHVEVLTRDSKDSYEAYIDRIVQYPVVIPIKIADLEDNMDLKTITRSLKQSDMERLKKYHLTWRRLKNIQENDEN